jgi:hypothetical protein
MSVEDRRRALGEVEAAERGDDAEAGGTRQYYLLHRVEQDPAPR